MACLKNVVSIFVLCAVLAVTLGQVQQGGGYVNQYGSHHNQIRIRRQIEFIEENQAQEDSAILENQDQADAAPENQEKDGATPEEQEDATPEEQENAILEKQEQEDTTPENQEQEQQEDVSKVVTEETTPSAIYPFWTTCNFGADPFKSCYDCNSLLICKRIVGLVKPCGNPFRPYCNNGFCSPVPSAECA